MVWVNVVVLIAGGFVTLDRSARAIVLIRRAKGTRRSKSPTVLKEALQVSLSLSPSFHTSPSLRLVFIVASPICPFVGLSVDLYCRFSRLSVCRSVCGSLLSLLPSVRLSVCLWIFIVASPVCPFVGLSVDLYCRFSVCPFVGLSVDLYCRFSRLSVCRSVSCVPAFLKIYF